MWDTVMADAFAGNLEKHGVLHLRGGGVVW